MTIGVLDSIVLDRGTLSFSIESRILRELGERLVKQPEVALLELVKNAYDADATLCTIIYDPPRSITVEDTGSGMTLKQFTNGWMRIGTSAKEWISFSEKFSRLITGEKGIGRFAVRFLGRHLHLESIADDPDRRQRTRLVADFDWPKFDRHEDLGKISVPYRVEVAAPGGQPTGTKLLITRLRPEIERLDFKKVRTGSMGVLTPLRSLFRPNSLSEIDIPTDRSEHAPDPGFQLRIRYGSADDESNSDVAADILEGFVLRARLELVGDKLELCIYRRGVANPYLRVVDTYENNLGQLYADIRFFPRRKGSFVDLPVDGRLAYSWVVDNAGVAVFDRSFRVHPYGMPGDDWLRLSADAARNRRDPRSTVALKHFPMSPAVRASTSENWMLRLPQPAQLVGLVQVRGRRTAESAEEGLVPSADREGFVDNKAFQQLYDLARGAVELIAVADRSLQQEAEQKQRDELFASIHAETQSAISEIRANPRISSQDKTRIITALAQTQRLAERQEERARDREQRLEVMSLLGVVAGFMTHEFGVALQELETAHSDLVALAAADPKFGEVAKKFAHHIRNLREFVTYSQAYIQGSKIKPSKPYPARPRLMQIRRIYGKYAEERNISVEISAEPALMAPLVPASLYNGIALNLYTNALKAVTAKAGNGAGVIAFRAWNDNRWHYLEVSDNGIGIPSALQRHVFDPLFSTTESHRDPLGSGMGLGLTLVKRASEAFGGTAELVAPPPSFATCVRVRLPLVGEGDR
jgi:signal transduction histidine kinase